MDRVNLYKYNNRQILVELGNCLKRKRLNMNMQQSELAERCGVNISTIHGIENGNNTSLTTFLAILRELKEFVPFYNAFLTPDPISPDILAKLTMNQRLRAKKPKNKQP